MLGLKKCFVRTPHTRSPHTHVDERRNMDDVVFWRHTTQSEFALNERTAMRAFEEGDGPFLTQNLSKDALRALQLYTLLSPARVRERDRSLAPNPPEGQGPFLPNWWSVYITPSTPGADEPPPDGSQTFVGLTPAREARRLALMVPWALTRTIVVQEMSQEKPPNLPFNPCGLSKVGCVLILSFRPPAVQRRCCVTAQFIMSRRV